MFNTTVAIGISHLSPRLASGKRRTNTHVVMQLLTNVGAEAEAE